MPAEIGLGVTSDNPTSPPRGGSQCVSGETVDECCRQGGLVVYKRLRIDDVPKVTPFRLTSRSSSPWRSAANADVARGIPRPRRDPHPPRDFLRCCDVAPNENRALLRNRRGVRRARVALGRARVVVVLSNAGNESANAGTSARKDIVLGGHVRGGPQQNPGHRRPPGRRRRQTPTRTSSIRCIRSRRSRRRLTPTRPRRPRRRRRRPRPPHRWSSSTDPSPIGDPKRRERERVGCARARGGTDDERGRQETPRPIRVDHQHRT